jgi:preprotein translocase subunit Sss1
MDENSVSSRKKLSNQPVTSRFITVFILGAIGGVFAGVLGMAVTILILGFLRLVFPDAVFQMGGVRVTAVVFAVFCALGWFGFGLYLWHKLPPFPSDM